MGRCHCMSIKPLANIRPAERAFLRLVRKYGRPAPASKHIDAQAPLADDGESDCWTHAWNVARARGALYVEGVCRRPGTTGVSMHAWVEETTPFGRRIVECTPGYEQASMYVGLPLDPRPGGPAAKATREWPTNEPRASVLQAAIQTGIEADEVLAQFVIQGPTQ